MIHLEIIGKPVPWAASKHCGSHHYDPKGKEKESVRWQIKSQYRDMPLQGALHIDFTFFVPIPKNTPYLRRRMMLSHQIKPLTKPDTTNLQKLYEDCLKNIVIEDDKIVTDVSSRKRYSDNPRVVIRVISLCNNAPSELREYLDLQKSIDKPEEILIKKRERRPTKNKILQIYT